jgi:hypothetical protein
MNFTRASPQSRGRFAASARHSRRRCRARVVVRRPVSFGRAASLAAARGAVTGAVAGGEDGAGASSGVPGTGLGGGAGDATGGGAAAGDPAGAPCAPAARGDSSATASNPTRAVCRRYGPAPNVASNDCMAFLPFEQPQGQAPRSRRGCLYNGPRVRLLLGRSGKLRHSRLARRPVDDRNGGRTFPFRVAGNRLAAHHDRE